MKLKLGLLIFIMSFNFAMSQSKTFWQRQSIDNTTRIKSSKQTLPKTHTFSLNLEGLKQALINAPQRGQFTKSSNTIMTFPNEDGTFESFRIVEASVLSPELQERYPNIKSYAGQGIGDPSAVIRFSISPLGFQSMKLSANKPATFIEALTTNGSHYAAFKRADKINFNDDFECSVTEKVNKEMNNGMQQRNADDAILRTYRLAVSTTGEYTAYHGGTKALALAAINQTMTRVNGIFENDFNVTMMLISNNDDVIYTNSGNDPYTTSGNYNGQLQSTLTSVIGESNYDIGHLFARASNNGNAGCIGCVCVNGQKGSGFTSRTDPEGDPFDVDYVAHEIGHQFGGNHTWTFNGNEGANAQMEPGSGSTIMGYAGITGATDVQANSDPYFHARSIEQITDYIKTTSCQTNTNTGNSVPAVNAGLNYTIPKGTAFVLDGSATDANSGDVLTYCWEQYDENNAATTNPSVNSTSGVAFRSYSPKTSTDRYFPRLSTIKTGATSWQWEAVPNVARSLNFRLTVRDNRVGGATNNSDDMVVSVNGTAGPFVVNSPNTNVSWNAGTSQAVTWNVAGTTGNGVNAANVDIFLSTDGGDTYPIALAFGVTNDGSHDIVVPNTQGSQNRVMVRGANNIFFDISNSNFTIAGQVVCNAIIPSGLSASNVGSSTATVSWNAVAGATYDLRYRTVGSSTWTTNAVTGISANLSGLTVLTQYEAQVRSKCSGGSNSSYSSSINFTTTDVQLDYCNSASTNTNDEFISRVQLNTINNASGAQFYSDFTNVSTTLTKDTQYTITVTPTWTGTVYSEGYSVWIDYNRDGDFTDAGEQVWTQAATQNTPVTGNFTIPNGAVENATRMRVSMKYNGIPSECETFQYGEVEDYTVIIEGSGPDLEVPVISLNGASTVNLNPGDTYNELGATATDNVDGNISGSIIIGGDTVNTNVLGSYVVTFNVSDAAGNDAAEVIRTVIVSDTTAPVITLIGAATINLNVGDTYNEQGATVTDNFDGNLTSSIAVTGVVNTNSAGTYVVNYNVSDTSGNSATQVIRTVIVTEDTTPPVISLIGASTVNLNVGDTYNEQGATATDNQDGNLTSSIVIAGTVNTNSAGTYLVNYNVSDAAGNAATQVTRTVNVSDPSSGCSGGITSFPYAEGFENTLGAWTQSSADDIDWTVDANGTPSSGTGPSSASQGSFYVFVEASGNNTGYPTKQAILNSPCFDLSGLSDAIFSFKYHQFGAADMGSIALEASDDNGATWTSLWSSTGNLGNSWLTTNVDISSYVGATVQLRFNRVTGGTWQADIAIDDIGLSEGGNTGGNGCSGGITSYPYSEGFENTLGAWTQSSADDLNWTVDANGTPSNGTGPSSAIQGSFYVFVEASGNNTGYPTKQAILNSPCFDLSAQSSATFTFNYHQFGSNNMGTIALEASDDNGASWTSVWNSSGNLGNSWQSASVNLSTYTGGSLQLRFNRVTGSTWQADIAIDNVNMSAGSAKDVTARPEVIDVKDITLYPNPVKGGVLRVKTDYTNMSYEIYNIVGQLVGRGIVKNKSIDVSSLDGAIYQIRFTSEGETITKRFVKQ
ncbi:immunoglobulin-like domain-containing protein [Psychroserpens burtonensis]|uniref:immunoglobulin-like domain-containing protein n=1 Tax=Psychroserpens burtonensis TaxID=49278 RepID=UPI0003FC46AA|nr:immunoglobulin-like domain-containing protein [Psychroserpens burtonensis]